MKLIPLTQGKFAKVDDEDFEWINMWKWRLASKGYASRKEKGETIFMHRQLINTPDGMETDHINGDGLDNRRENLRICTSAENKHNYRKPKNNTSGFKGVSFNKETHKWAGSISPNRKKIHLGYFNDPVSAAFAYDLAAKKYFGDFANINFPLCEDLNYSI